MIMTRRRAGHRVPAGAVGVGGLVLVVGLAPWAIAQVRSTATADSPVSSVVTADGGRVSGLGVTVVVPASAVAVPTVIGLAAATDAPGYRGASTLAAFTVTARGVADDTALTGFAAPVDVEVSLAGLGSRPVSPGRVSLASLGLDGAWSTLAARPGLDSLTVSVDGPGTFGVLPSPTTPPPATPATTPQPSATAPSTPQPSATAPSTPQPSATQPSIPSPSIPSPSIPSPSIPSPSTTQLPAASVGPAVSVAHTVFARVDGPPFRATYLAADTPVVDAMRLQTLRVGFSVHNDGALPVTITPQLEFRPQDGTDWVLVPATLTAGAAFYTSREWVDRPTRRGSDQGPESAAIAVGEFVVPASGSPAAGVPGQRSMGANPDQAVTLAPGASTEQEFTLRTTVDAQYESGYDLRLTDSGQPLSGVAGARLRLGRPQVPQLTPGQRQGIRVLDPRTKQNPTGDPLPRQLPSAGPAPTPSVSSPAPTPSVSSPAPTPSVSSPTPTPSVSSPAPEPGVPSPSTSDVATPAVTPSAAPAAGVAGAASALLAPLRWAVTLATPVTTELTSLVLGSRVLRAAPVAAAPAAAAPVAVAPMAAAGPFSADIHGPYTLTSDQCGTCHKAHSAGSRTLLNAVGPQSALCLSCHDGLGASTDVKGQLSDPAHPANDPATRSYYRHDTTVTTNHTASTDNEFGGVSNRHTECGDCHSGHKASPTDTTETIGGWGASGRIAGASGVSVVNGPAGTAPAYSFLDGDGSPVVAEYQLCLKCHSGFTSLPSNDGFSPSQYVLDKGVELNPNNASFHPVEAMGANQTVMMSSSLAGSSPYKLWNFTTSGTVRCTNCHAGEGSYSTAPTTPVGGDLAPHASSNRGILLQNYRDRELKSSNEYYDASDFALCYLCHSEAPFVQGGDATDTNFVYHGMHVSDIRGEGAGGTDIDTPGAGAGNALCAECHYRPHSTAFAPGTQTNSGTRLVSFAPDVQPNRAGVLSWTQGATGHGTCSLLCHGMNHTNMPY